jgi:hypothetical protein
MSPFIDLIDDPQDYRGKLLLDSSKNTNHGKLNIHDNYLIKTQCVRELNTLFYFAQVC